MLKKWLQNDEGIPLWKLPEPQRAALVAFVPLLYFAFVIRTEFTYGDGPELLTAAMRFGISHPSGYPLYTLLSSIPAHLPGISPYYHVSFLMSAVPTAAAAALIYLLLRRLEVAWPIATLAGWLWAFDNEVVYLATRVEVYALHCMFVMGSLYAFTRFAKSDGYRWAYISVACVCLGLTNHLTSSFLVVPISVGLLIVDRKWLLQPKVVGRMLGIAAAGASVYLYFPLAAMANSGDRITWNDPQTFERFWFHVTGAEYSIFRSLDKLTSSFPKFGNSVDATFFMGAKFLALLGLWEAWVRTRVVTFVMMVFFCSFLIYIGTYNINDISTYFTGLYLIIAMLLAIAADWLVRARLEGDSKWMVNTRYLLLAIALGWSGNRAIKTWGNHYREATAQDMSASVYEGMKQPAIIFTSVDGHSFPMWYQRYVNHPGDKVIPIDQVMFRLDNKLWYRDYHRDHFDWVKWPTDAQVKKGGWEQWLIDNNPDVNFYALMQNGWRSSRSHPVNRGWHFELKRNPQGQTPKYTKYGKHIYTSRLKRYRGAVYPYDAKTTYASGTDKIACFAEWTRHPDLTAHWKFIGPQGQEVTFPPHAIPQNSNMSWEFLEVKDQTPGTWRCEVSEPSEPLLVTEFTLE